MSEDILLVEHQPGRHDRLVLTSVANRNALSERLLRELIDQIAAARTSSARLMILDHAGLSFCSGVDLRERAAAGDDAPHSTLLAELLRNLWTFPKPLLARVDGAVRGGGMAVLACCDIVVAGPSSGFGYSEVRVGVVPALVAAVTFPRLSPATVGPWMLTGEPFDAAEAARLGIVTRVAHQEPASVELEAHAILQGGPDAVLATKQLLKAELTPAVLDALSRTETESRHAFRTTEAQEGMASFQARRHPTWVPATSL